MIGWCLYQQRGDSSPFHLGDAVREEEDNHKEAAGCEFWLLFPAAGLRKKSIRCCLSEFCS